MLRGPWRSSYHLRSGVQSYLRLFLAIRLFVWLQSKTHPEGLRPTPLIDQQSSLVLSVPLQERVLILHHNLQALGETSCEGHNRHQAQLQLSI